MKVLFVAIMVGACFCVGPISAQDTSSNTHCKEIISSYEKISFEKGVPGDGLSEKEVLGIFECYLLEKGNHKPVWGVVLRNDISQTFGQSPREVIALFEISKLFFQSDSFAGAKVLRNLKSGSLNSRSSIKKAFKYYKRWLNTVRTKGLSEARRQKLDPLSGTQLRWY